MTSSLSQTTTRPEREDALAMQQWKAHHEETEKQALLRKQKQQRDEVLHPKRKPLHHFFTLVQLITILASLAMALGQCFGVFFESWLGIIDYVLRLYVLLFCGLAVVNESKFGSLTQDSKVLRVWISRGLFYGFIGVLGLCENAAVPTIVQDSSNDRKFLRRDFALHFIVLASWVMVSVGMLYSVMGILCLQLVYNQMEEEYRTRVERAKEEQNKANRASYGTAIEV